jgi:poly-beta-1,6-N-acetyl-D-glucosamine synthase
MSISTFWVARLVFWLAAFAIFYTYIGYPAFILLWSKIDKRSTNKKSGYSRPFVTVVIAARDEEENIGARIADILDQDYPKEKLEIIVVSDGSTDGTTTVLDRLTAQINAGRTHNPLLRSLSCGSSRGKPSAINMGVSEARGELIVFADCRQRFSTDAITHLVANFSDPEVGCVSGELVFEESRGSSIRAEMDAYWRFEKWLRKLESATGSVPGATGAIYAIRRELFDPLPDPTLLDDVLVPLRVRMKGYRVIFEGSAIAYDTVSKDFLKEKKRKIRTLAGNWQLLLLEPRILNPVKNPLWFKFLSHKTLRLLVPYFFFLLVAAALFVHDFVSALLLLFLVVCLCVALFPQLPGRLRGLSKARRIVRAVVMLNYFAAMAPFSFVANRKRLW